MEFPSVSLRRRFACLALALSLVLCAVAGQLTESIPTAAPPENAVLQAYLKSCGWECDLSTVTTEEVVLPHAFDASYDEYLACQRECGFRLEDYAGQTLLRWSCAVTNYPTGETGVVADLLLYEGQVVGGDIRCTALNGFLHSLRR